MSIPQMPLPILLPRKPLHFPPLRTRILAIFHMTKENLRGIVDVVMVSLDIFWGLETPAADIAFHWVDV